MLKNVPPKAFAGVCFGVIIALVGVLLTLKGVLGILDGFFLLFAGVALVVPGLLFISEDKKRRLGRLSE